MQNGECGCARSDGVVVMTAQPAAAALPQGELDRVCALYEQGFYLRAYELARTFGPLAQWQGTAARVLASRLAPNLGAHRLGTALALTTWRHDQADAQACYYHGRALLGWRGPLRAWRFLQRVGPLDQAPEPVRSYWRAMHAIVLGYLRDFDAAESWLARAEQDAPERAAPWLLVERAELYNEEDRYLEALTAAREALALRPWYRPAVQCCAQFLQLLDRDGEALALLSEANERIESSTVAAQLGVLCSEMGRHSDAQRTWDRFVELSPLIDKPTRRWLAGRRSDTAYYCGDVVAAASLARDSGEPFFLALAERLESSTPLHRRVLLDVPFVRQHHQTCVPATLAAIARFWGKEADHLEVAEEICYDGTPDHRERSWGEENGLLPREFTVTWDSAVALLDRGVPFTLTTVHTQSAHLQAVIGYDDRRGTLLLRDPTLPCSGEVDAEGFLKGQRSAGPRGMALVPRERASLLESIELPDSLLYDDLHRMQVALREHDRARASLAYAALRARAPEHRLTLQARYVLAQYDADSAEVLAALQALLEAFPEDVNLRICQLGCLRLLGRRDERLAVYRELCSRPAADPILSREYAQELQADAREHATVAWLIRRVLRSRPLDTESFSILGDLAWEEGRRADTVELYRFAACLHDKNEGLARSYFNSARYLRRQEEALRFLEGRLQRFASRSAQPARTLYWALSQLERMPEAFAVLDKALVLRPDDGDLLLFAAGAHGERGEFDRAAERLEAARGRCRHGNWLRAAAGLARLRGDLSGALGLWRQLLEVEPSALDANRAVTHLLAETEGRAAALDHLAGTCDRFPHNYPLHQAWIEWLRKEGPEASEPAVRRLLAIHPADAWGHREAALVFSARGCHAEARAEIELATQLEPASTSEASVRAQVLEHAGRRTDAQEAYREAIRRSVDNDFAIGRLMELCESRAERIEALRFIRLELARQVIFGNGLLAFAQRARGILDSEELLAALRAAQTARPDLWHAWSALIGELSRRGEHGQALELAQEAVARFPLLPQIWLDLACVCKARSDRELQVEALSRALRINPGWSTAALHLAQAHEQERNFAQSRAVLERALAHAPLDPHNHGFLAHALWHLGEKEAALERLAQALRLDPGYEWAWDTLRSWSRALARPELAVKLARELTELRGGEPENWLALARSLRGPEHFDERFAALERAIVLAPRELKAYDLKAKLLAEAGRFDEAIAACEAGPWGEQPPLSLRGRAAWIQSQRGDLAGAIERMRAIVGEHPDYSWGWRKLAKWTCDAGTVAQYLEATEALVKLGPRDAFAAAYRGHARLKMGDRAAAKEEFRRALTLAIDYSYPAMQLFDLELADRNLDAAAGVFESLKTYCAGECVDAREVQLAAARNERAKATAALKRLCVSSKEESVRPLQAADSAFSKAGWANLAREIFEQALEAPECNPRVAELWVNHCVTSRRWRRLRKLRELLARGKLGQRAMVAYVKALGRARKSRRIAACIRNYRAFLRDDTKCWAVVGYALISIGRHREAVDWLADWPDRDGLQTWMLYNLAEALRALRRDEAANSVGRKALELKADGTTPRLHVWLALDDALEGKVADASARLADIKPSDLDTLYQYLHELAMILVDVEPDGATDGRIMLRTPGSRLRALVRRHAISRDDYPLALHAYHRAVRRMASQYGRVRGSIFTLLHSLDAPRKAR